MFVWFAHLPVIAALAILAFASAYLKKLTPAGAVTGFLCAAIIFFGAGYPGLLMLGGFFVAGTWATAVGRKTKKRMDREEDSGRRRPGQVLANAGVATLLAGGMLYYPPLEKVLGLMLASSLASATADTLSSELGMLYGRTFYNILSWKKEEAGLDGVISLEGTLIGVAGAGMIASFYSCWGRPNVQFFLLIVVAGAAGNFFDSLFGAAFERRRMINNDAVNFLSTAFAAVTAFFLTLILNSF